MMREEIDPADAPPEIEELIQGHLNTNRFLRKGWLRVTAALGVGLPLALIARGMPIAGALFTAAVVCAIVGGVLRLAVHVLHQIRARQVATEIEQRVPQDHPGRKSVDRWLMRRNRRGGLAAVLQELSGGELGSSARTYTYTTTQTQIWKNGEWVTVEDAPAEATPEELLERAAGESTPPVNIPLSGTSRRPAHLPLELEDFEPDDSPQPVDATRRGRTPP